MRNFTRHNFRWVATQVAIYGGALVLLLIAKHYAVPLGRWSL